MISRKWKVGKEETGKMRIIGTLSSSHDRYYIINIFFFAGDIYDYNISFF